MRAMLAKAGPVNGGVATAILQDFVAGPGLRRRGEESDLIQQGLLPGQSNSQGGVLECRTRARESQCDGWSRDGSHTITSTSAFATTTRRHVAS